MKTALLLILCSYLAWTASAQGIGDRPEPGQSVIAPKPLPGASLKERYGIQMDLQTMIIDEAGRQVTLASCMQQRPAFLAFVYYGCPSICNVLISKVFELSADCGYKPGKDFDVLFISFEPAETPILAAAKRASYLEHYGVDGTGIRFLTAPASSITSLTSTAGFSYQWNEATKVYDHPAIAHMLTADGRISHYLYGPGIPALDFKLAIMDASGGKIGTPVDRLLSFCYSYDSKSGRFVRSSMRIMTLGGTLTLLCLGIFLGILWRHELKNKKQQQDSKPQ